LKNEKISILIPAFNEEENIISTLKETVNVLENLKRDYEIIIIDDGSKDNTYNKVKSNIDTFNEKVKIYQYTPNIGKGFAIKYGFNYVDGDYVLFLDADLDIHPSQVDSFLKLIREHEADVVIGSKLNKNSVVQYPLSRRILSIGYYVLIKILFNLPVRDTQTGLKLFSYNTLKKALPKVVVKKYAFDLELLVILNKYKFKIVEAPIYLKPTRKFGRIGVRDIFNIFYDTIAIFYRLYIKKYYN
jgi:glycosyltransferase involved in cell wall biosynthesis